MAWSTPRTWAVGEILTAANMNTYISDNLAYLKSMVASQIELSGAGMTPGGGLAPAMGLIRTFMTSGEYFVGMGFAPGTMGIADVDLPAMPADYNGGAITAKFTWHVPSSSTNPVVWGIQGNCYADGEAMDTAVGAAGTISDANTGSNYINISASTANVTLAGSPAAGEAAHFRVYRLGTAPDTHAGTAVLLGVTISYTRA